MKMSGTFARGLLLGAGLMYLVDPSEGGRRRALVRDKGARALHRSSRIVGKAGRDLRNRARGRIAETVSGSRSGHAWLPRSWPRSVQYLAGAVGAVALVYGASRALQERRASRDESRLEPNYAYLR